MNAIATEPLNQEERASSDTAERERAELSLRHSEERYRSLVIATAQVVWTTDPEGHVTGPMPSWTDYTGIRTEDILGWGWINCVHPDDRAHTTEVWTKAVRTRSLYETEYRLRRKDGEYRHVIARGVPVLEPDGTIREWIGTCNDITERKRTERALRFERQRFQDVLDILPAYVVLLTPDYHFALTNREFCKRFGDPGERRCFEYLFGRTAPCENCDTYKVLKSKQPHHWTWTGPDKRDYEITDFPFSDAEGSRLILEMGMDITERKQREQQLQSQAALLDLAHDAIIVRDMQSRIVFWNPGAEQTYGYSAAEAMGRVTHDLLQTRFPVPLAGIEARTMDRGGWEGELEHTTRGGKKLIVASRWSLQRDDSGVPTSILEINRDITDRKRAEAARDVAEQELRRAHDQLENRVRERTAELAAANQELEAFTYSVSHDLRAPLRHVDSFGKLLEDHLGPRADEQTSHYLKRIRTGAQRMSRLVEDLLNLSRVGRQELRREPTALNAAVEAVLRELETGDRKIEWKIGSLPSANCDSALVKQVFFNLLANAVKFTAPREHAVIEIGCLNAAIYVRDNGVGFDMKYADKLFGAFQRLHPAEQFPGTGIGLATVRRIIVKHGGEIWAEAAPDAGATFYFTLGPSALLPSDTLETTECELTK